MAEAKVGQPAPNFDMPSTKNIEKLNENVELNDYKGRWVVLLFYPLDFTFVCPTELTSFSDRYDDFEGIGAAVIGVSTMPGPIPFSGIPAPAQSADGATRRIHRARAALVLL